jgi:hypothetical protein
MTNRPLVDGVEEKRNKGKEARYRDREGNETYDSDEMRGKERKKKIQYSMSDIK